MTTLSPTLSLVLYNATTDAGATFAAFRASVAGETAASNFYIIDTAIGTMQTDITALSGSKGATYIPGILSSGTTYAATGVAGISSYTTGLQIILSVDTTITGAPTININTLGAKNLMKMDNAGTVASLVAGDLSKGRYYLFRYDGTRFLWVSANTADQINIAGTSGNVVTVNSDNTLLGTTTQSVLISGTTHAATPKTTPVDADETGIVDSAASNVLKKVTWANVKATLKTYFDTLYVTLSGHPALMASDTHAATTKTTPVDADETLLADSAATYGLKKLTWANLKATLKTYFDTLYVLIANHPTLMASDTHAATNKTPPVDADEFPITDSAATYGLKHLTWANLKATIASYYDTYSTTMTNKTLTNPVIASISNSGTVTIPAGTDTLVAKATTDTLTNKRITKRVTALTSSATPTINSDNCDVVDITALATNITNMSTNLTGTPTNKQTLLFEIKGDATPRTISWGTSFVAGGVDLPATTTASKILTVGFMYSTANSLNKWRCIASLQEA